MSERVEKIEGNIQCLIRKGKSILKETRKYLYFHEPALQVYIKNYNYFLMRVLLYLTIVFFFFNLFVFLRNILEIAEILPLKQQFEIIL